MSTTTRRRAAKPKAKPKPKPAPVKLDPSPAEIAALAAGIRAARGDRLLGRERGGGGADRGPRETRVYSVLFEDNRGCEAR